MVPDAQHSRLDQRLDLREVDRHPGLGIDRKVERQGEAVRMPVKVEALAGVEGEAMRGLEAEGLSDDHRAARSRWISTLTASTIPSRIGVTFRTRTRIEEALVVVRIAVAIRSARVSIRW